MTVESSIKPVRETPVRMIPRISVTRRLTEVTYDPQEDTARQQVVLENRESRTYQ